jgi:hypothetical protein
MLERAVFAEEPSPAAEQPIRNAVAARHAADARAGLVALRNDPGLLGGTPAPPRPSRLALAVRAVHCRHLHSIELG